MRGIKVTNEYAESIPGYNQTPKAVYAALAYSFAMLLAEDNPTRALGFLETEWRTLYENSLVPQKPIAIQPSEEQ